VKLKPGVLQHNDRTKQNVKEAGRSRGRGSTEASVDESQFVQMKSVFAEGPMVAQAHVNNSRIHHGKFGIFIDDCSFYILCFYLFNKYVVHNLLLKLQCMQIECEEVFVCFSFSLIIIIINGIYIAQVHKSQCN